MSLKLMLLNNSQVNGSQPLYKLLELLACIIVAFLCNNSFLQAADISTFEITDISGSLSLKLLTDSKEFINQGITAQKYESQLWQKELSLDINSYIYHPNFLKMDLSAGFLSDQTKFDTSGNKTTTKKQVNNFSARLDFLSKKPTPFSVYYNKTNTTVPTGSAGNFLLERIRYGSEISLLSPLSPVSIKLSNYRETSYGEGANQITDDIIERTNLDMSYPYGVGAYIKLNQQYNNSISRSGSLSSTIVESESKTSSTGLNTRNSFGSERQLRLDINSGYQKQEEFPERESWFFRPNLDWKHNKTFTSHYTYETNNTKELDRVTENNKSAARLNYFGNDSLTGIVNLTHNNSKSTGYEFEDKGASFNVTKKIDVPYGKYSLSYTAGINNRDQTSTVDLIPVIGDEYILNGITQTNINHDNIDTTTIRVWNITRSQEFILDQDYSITTIGDQVLIERLITGIIADGQSVLIDYSYRTGGTIKYDQQKQNLNTSLTIGKHYELSAQYYQSKQNLLEGTPTTNLNSSDGVVLSLRVNKPLKKGITTGGKLQAQKHNEDNNPYNKQTIDAFVNLPLLEKATLKLNTGLMKINYENSDEDTDKKSLGLLLHAKPWTLVSTSFDSNYSKDTGSSSERTRFVSNLNFSWHYRQLDYKATIKNQSEKQGNIERDDWSIYMKLQRAF